MREATPGFDAMDQPPSGDTVFDDPALEAAFGLASETGWIERARQSEAAPPPPGHLGPYELLEEIGRGGQGVVFKAVQPGTGRVIAIKRLAARHALGNRHRARFAQEVQALVRLHHPSIVTVHAAEEIAGSPVLLMEHVEGEAIDRWADGARPGAGRRPLAAMLCAFAQVCDAVAHAHQRGVIHRDLKPSNVLVDATGIPRVLDFGVAHLVGDLQSRPHNEATLTCFAGTPAYAPPEQLGGSRDADTRTDVYSLGALLYRLLTGREPFSRELSLAALIDAVRDGAVRRPSLVCPALPGELDWVVLKAMHSDPSRRYQTVDALGADVRRFLAGQPIAAHPPSRRYSAAKFVRRNMLACSATGTALAMILVLTGVSIVQAVRVSRQNQSLVLAIERETRAREEADAARARADSQAAEQREITRAIGDAVASIAAWAGRTPFRNASEFLASIDSEFAKLNEPQDPESRVQFHALRARLAESADRYEESLTHWLTAIATAEGVYAGPDPRLSTLRRHGGNAFLRLERLDEAIWLVTRALETDEQDERRVALASLCGLQIRVGDLARARATADQLVHEAGGDPLKLSAALELAANIDLAQGLNEEARTRLEAALDLLQSAGQQGGFDAAWLRVRLATLLLREGLPEQAEPLAAAVASFRLARNGPMNNRTQEALLTHAESLSRLGRFAEAAERFEQALPRMDAAYGRDSRRVACHHFKLAAAYLGAGARAEGRRNLAIALSLGAGNDPDNPSLGADVDACEAAIAANSWQVSPELAQALGPLEWLVASPPDVPAAVPEGGSLDRTVPR